MKSLAAQVISIAMRLFAEMGFDSRVKKPEKATEKELKRVLQDFVINNSHEPVSERIEGILYLLENGKYKKLLSPAGHEWAWRFLDATSPKKLEKILGRSLRKSSKPLKLRAGTLHPDEKGLSSWTVNPRSLVYSGFFSVLPKNSNLVLVRAKISENDFFGNPDELVSQLKFPKDFYAPGYALEREVVGVGPIKYTDGAYLLRDGSRSLESLAMDLINKLDPVDKKELSDWSEEYYFPKL